MLPALGRRGQSAAAQHRLAPASASSRLPRPSRSPSSRATSPDQLDLLAVIKASQTISGVMGREELVRTLLQIVIEQGGARRARLVRVRDGELEIAAEQTLAPEKDAGETAEPAEPAPRAAAGRVPTSILHYVARTRERVVLDDAAADAGRFASDPYLAGARPRSVLCLPIRREGRVVALLYLENELAPACSPPTGSWRWSSSPPRSPSRSRTLSCSNGSTKAAWRPRPPAGGRSSWAKRRRWCRRRSTTKTSSVRSPASACASSADWAVIDIVDHDRIVRIAAAHRDPVKEPLMRELTQRYTPRFGVPSLAMSVIERGTPTHLPDADARRRPPPVRG